MQSIIKLVIVIVLIFSMPLIDVIFEYIYCVPQFIYYKIYDLRHKLVKFPFYGCKFYVGKQGSGKTISMVNELEHIRHKYPNCKIYTNFGYKYQNYNLSDISDLTNEYFYNGDDGCVFAIDEIQNEFSCLDSKNVPVEILSAITQQRKHKCYIICTSQMFGRVAKPLREQAFFVTECTTLFGRLTSNRQYDGYEYSETNEETISYKKSHRHVQKFDVFVQSNYLRDLYDSFAIIKRLKRGVRYEKGNLPVYSSVFFE